LPFRRKQNKKHITGIIFFTSLFARGMPGNTRGGAHGIKRFDGSYHVF
jgi:hypothetical protein